MQVRKYFPKYSKIQQNFFIQMLTVTILWRQCTILFHQKLQKELDQHANLSLANLSITLI